MAVQKEKYSLGHNVKNFILLSRSLVTSVLSPQPLICPCVGVAIRIERGLHEEFKVRGVLGEFSIYRLVDEPLAVGGRDPFPSVDSAVHRNHFNEIQATLYNKQYSSFVNVKIFS